MPNDLPIRGIICVDLIRKMHKNISFHLIFMLKFIDDSGKIKKSSIVVNCFAGKCKQYVFLVRSLTLLKFSVICWHVLQALFKSFLASLACKRKRQIKEQESSRSSGRQEDSISHPDKLTQSRFHDKSSLHLIH